MNITDPVVLRNDVLLIPVADLAPDVKEKFTFDEGDFTLSRRHGRAPSQVVDGETASLLQLFRTPRTIVDAVIENSRALKKDPESWLDELLPHIGTFLQNRVLVPAGAEDEQEFDQTLTAGAHIGPWEVLHCVSLIEDSEIYRVRDGARDGALKIARAPMHFEHSLFGNEAAALRHLEGSVAAALYDSGMHEERPYLVIEWCSGMDAATAAAHKRHDRAAQLEIACAVADAYAELHGRGVVHGDVHPRNIIVSDDGSARVIDFGLACILGQHPRVGRGGMYYFYEPELLAAQRAGGSSPAIPAAEQYSLAAMLYLLIAGDHYLAFRYEREEMVRQVESDDPLPFTARNLAPWPEIEAILGRALSKDPAQRYESTAAFATALRNAHGAAVAEARATPLSDRARAFLDETIALFSRGGAMFERGFTEAPTASINFGSAGAAVGLLRIAEIRSDASLLALADVWRSRALADLGKHTAYYNETIDLEPKLLGSITPYHTGSGIHAAAALVAHARGDVTAQRLALRQFIAATQDECAEVDLTLGQGAVLIACSILLEVSRDLPEGEGLLNLGNGKLASIWSALDARPPIAENAADAYFGLAHGWSGYLYETLRWCAASGAPIPATLPGRLSEFESLRVRRGRASYWRRQIGGHPMDILPGWCNGSAGHVFLFTAAYDAYRDERFLRLAEEVALHAADEPMYTADLCCGSAGRAYGLLNLYKHTGDTDWLARARRLANHAAGYTGEQTRANSLWKGELGVAVLIADLESPENAQMPFFE
jgi:serine/threonine-protein kinase